MKKIKTLLILSLCLFSLTNIYAGNFEGIITQSVTDATKGNFTLKWYIQGVNVALEIQTNENSLYFIPKSNQLLMYSKEPNLEGKKTYTFVPVEYLADEIQEIKPFLKANTENISGYNCQLISLSGNSVGSFYFTKEIDFVTNQLAKFFSTSYEIKALANLGINGFPLKSEIYSNGILVSKIETKSIEKVSVPKTIFEIPAGYSDLPIVK